MATIVVLPDLLRGARAFPEGFFDLIREPIRQGVGQDIGFPPGTKKSSGLYPGFDLQRFRALAGVDMDSPAQQAQWHASYHDLFDEAVNYLFDHMPANTLLLGFEMPPWLAKASVDRGHAFIDIRPSPLRFARDLYIALRCSSAEVASRIQPFEVPEEELRLEASLLASNVRMHQRRLEDERGWRFEDLDECLLFIGQAPYDASLLAQGGRLLNYGDFAEKIRYLSEGRKLVYKPHPFALEQVEFERAQLERITGQPVATCQQNAYQILSSHDSVELVGISSGFLQEAFWFEKSAHMLYQPFVPLRNGEVIDSHAYRQIHFHTFLSPAFWHQVLAPERAAPRVPALTKLSHNHARETLDQWWDFSKVVTWERTIPYESFMRGGGALLKRKIDLLNDAEGGSAKTGGSNESFKELSFSLYSRLASAYKGFTDAIAKNTSPDHYKERILDSAYYQSLHEKNALFKENNWLLPYVDFIRSKGFSTVREVGCGNGAFVAAISGSVDKVVGLDWARSPGFPEGENIEFQCLDLTSAKLDFFDLNCSADVLEHIETEKLAALIDSLDKSAKFNFHVIACYDDGHSHLSILPPDAWLYLFRVHSPSYRIMDISIRRGNVNHIVCAVTNL